MTEEKQKTLINFKKANGLLSKMIKMIETDEYCINIMQQNLAAIGLLKSAHQMLMEGHLHSCFSRAMASQNTRRQNTMIYEVLTVMRLCNR